DGQQAYRIAVQRSRRLRGSAFLHDHVVVGTRLAVSHPRNHFSLDRRDTHSLLIAGGIGITPILSMARSLALRKRPFALVYAGRAPQDMAYLSEVRSLAGATVQVHCSTEHGGARLDLHALLAAQPAGTTTYVCGPATLIAATRAAAKALSWEPARVRSESFASVPANDDSGFALVLHKSGRTLQVAADASILETMAAAGLTPLFDCGMGECGVCPLVVLQADGSLEHRDRYLSAEAKAAGDTLCICVSRLRGTRLVLDA
ncbi:MAG: oxidoreductase, partial [Rhodoferax sp.]|nr:oxidoreductase [Rhodoferax sp.]